MLSFLHLQPTVQKDEAPEVVAEVKEEAPKKPRTRTKPKETGEADATAND